MMSESAIKAIQESESIKAANAELPAGSQSVIALPDSFHVHDLEKYMPTRSYFRGEFKTSDIDQFTSYVKKNEQDCMACFIDHESMRAETIFDLLDDMGLPLHAKHTASVKLKSTPEYSTLISNSGRQLSQKNIAEFLEDHIDFVTFLADGDQDGEMAEIHRVKAINAIRNITIESSSREDNSVGDFNAERSVLESTNAHSGNETLPKLIRFKLKPYDTDALEEYDFDCRLSLSKRDGELNMKLSIRSLDRIQNQIAKDFAAAIKDRLDGVSMDIYTGEFNANP